MEKQTIHVAYALNDNYTELTSVSMASLLHNTLNPVNFHVIESRLSDENKDILRSLKNRFPHGTWMFYEAGGSYRDSFIETGHLTYEAYYRLLLPEMFPYLDKMIYLDCDTVVDGDIAELWHIDLKDKLLAAGQCLYLPICEGFASIFRPSGRYFNSGVMLLSLQKLREFDLSARAIPIIPTLHKLSTDNNFFFLHDELVLNYLLYDQYLPLPAKFNVNLHCDFDFSFVDLDLQDFCAARVTSTLSYYVCVAKNRQRQP